MSRQLTCQLFVPDERLYPERVGHLVSELTLSGFAFQREPDGLGAYAVDCEWYEGSVGQAVNSFKESTEWAVEMVKGLANEQVVEVHLSIARAAPERGRPLHSVSLSTSLPYSGPKLQLAQEFSAWSTFTAELTHPVYGWAGSSLGLLDREVVPVSQESVSMLAPQPVEWLNIFGVPYVRKIGIERLRSLPSGEMRFLCDGGVSVTMSADPDSVKIDAVRIAAAHLGLLFPFP